MGAFASNYWEFCSFFAHKSNLFFWREISNYIIVCLLLEEDCAFQNPTKIVSCLISRVFFNPFRQNILFGGNIQNLKFINYCCSSSSGRGLGISKSSKNVSCLMAKMVYK